METDPIYGPVPEGGCWPPLPLEPWRDTYATLHLWTQVVGKIRLARTPPVNHWWGVPFYVTAMGLTTSPIPFGGRSGASLQIDFDFCSHRLRMRNTEGKSLVFPLRPMSVAAFHRETMDCLHSMGMPVAIRTLPVEIENPIPFEADEIHQTYDAKQVWRFFQILVLSEQVFTLFRGRFLGKTSPVHFFWGGFDLAVTRFSGRAAPDHPPVPHTPLAVVREDYSHEVYGCGFWPGDDLTRGAAYYAYAYPEPPGFRDADIGLAGAYYNRHLGEFILPYERVRDSEKPRETLLRFLESTYAAAADLGAWDREALERRAAEAATDP